jgi:hypothetical protein
MNFTWKKFWSTGILFGFFAFLPMSCGLLCWDSCGCGPSPEKQEIRIKSFLTMPVDQSNTEIPVTETRPFDQSFIRLRIDEVEVKAQSSFEQKPSWTMGTAFACSPAPPVSQNTLYLIQIISEKEFITHDGTQYAIGDNISLLFGMSYFFAQELTTLQNFIAPGLRLTYDDFFKIGLLEDPEKELNLKFTIRLRFDDAQEFLLTDQILNIQ